MRLGDFETYRDIVTMPNSNIEFNAELITILKEIQFSLHSMSGCLIEIHKELRDISDDVRFIKYKQEGYSSE